MMFGYNNIMITDLAWTVYGVVGKVGKEDNLLFVADIISCLS